jgi:flagellar M-ring protein FliF
MGREQAEKLLASIVGLGARRLAALAFVGLAVLSLIAVGTYYLSRPEQQVLYSGLTREDVSRIGGALKDVGIDFDVSSDGTTVTVGYEDAARARMILAEKGLPQSADSGYELFNQVGSFGLTSFMQEVTKTRALEGELARTIQGMAGIKSARVHLVLPDRGSFRSDQQQATASVVIRTENQSEASTAQAIRHLVAAAVPGLKLDGVTVLSTDGTVLASGDDPLDASAGKKAMIEQAVDNEIEEKVRRTLTPYLGIGNFQVSVVSRLNLDRTTTSETIYDPNSRVERSVRTIKQNDLTQNKSTDAPASVGEKLPDQGAVAQGGKQSNETNERKEELTNYEVSSKTIETAHDGYTIEKLSVAVLVNKQRLVAAAGEGQDAVPVEHQLMDIEQLIASAAGIAKDRGDQLKVAAVAFVDDTAPADQAASASGGMMDMVLGQIGTLINAIAIIVVAVLVILFGLRPAVKAIIAASPPPAAGAPGGPGMPALEGPVGLEATAAEPGGGPAQIGSEGPINLIEDVTKKMNRSPQKRLEQIVEFDEAQAAAILRQWLHSQGTA